MTVAELAKQFNIPVARLLDMISDAGIAVGDATETMSPAQKVALIEHMKQRKTRTLRPNQTDRKEKPAQGVKPSANRSSAREKKPREEKKLSPREIAQKMAEKKRVEQGNVQRESEEKSHQQAVASEARRHEERQGRKARRAEEAARAAQEAEERAQNERALQKKLAEQEKERRKREAEEARQNAEQELLKQQEREKRSAAEKAELERQRQEALKDVEKREGYEKEVETRFHLHDAQPAFPARSERSGKRTARTGEYARRVGNKRSGAALRKKERKGGSFEKPAVPVSREIRIPETITVGDLAQKMSIKAGELIKTMMKMGSMVTINQLLDQETAALVADEMGHKYQLLRENELEEQVIAEATENVDDVVARAPVVTIMGHVDHGKTSLLDYIRNAHVTVGEAGGITQHIGAYRVDTERGQITFLDTPGHAAFTAMRARGADVTDIVVLVVSADDGVMPQTREAIQHAKAADVPVIVAVNKIDKPEANLERVKSELSQEEIISEEWGGDNLFAYVSAKTGEGIDDLLEKILIQAELLELTAPSTGIGKGAVIESRLDRSRGSVATVLVQSGRMKKGEIMLAGMEYGRIRALLNEQGDELAEAGPSTPVEVLGLSGTPNAGDEVIIVENERKAREIANFRQGKFRETKIARQQKAKLENLFKPGESGEGKKINLIVKADVQGSVEALSEALGKLSGDAVAVAILATGIGAISESDVQLALASQATIIAFNVRPEANAKRMIDEEGLDLRYYSVIYEAIDDVRAAMQGMLSPEIREDIIGLAEVKEVFRSSKLGAVAGCIVADGVLKSHNPIRVLRDNVVVYEGELESLRRFKDDVAEVRAGTECGLGVKNYNDVKVGDQIECYQRISVARTL